MEGIPIFIFGLFLTPAYFWKDYWQHADMYTIHEIKFKRANQIEEFSDDYKYGVIILFPLNGDSMKFIISNGIIN